MGGPCEQRRTQRGRRSCATFRAPTGTGSGADYAFDSQLLVPCWSCRCRCRACRRHVLPLSLSLPVPPPQGNWRAGTLTLLRRASWHRHRVRRGASTRQSSRRRRWWRRRGGRCPSTRSQHPRQRPMSRRSAVITQCVSQTFNCSGKTPGHTGNGRDGVDEARGSRWPRLGHVGGVPKLVWWWHCEPRRRRSERYAVLIEPTWLCEAGSEQEEEWINGGGRRW